MADKAVVTQTTLDAIGQAIIAKGGATAPMTPAQMPSAIAAIPSGSTWEPPSYWPNIREIVKNDTGYPEHPEWTRRLILLMNPLGSTDNYYTLKGCRGYKTSDGNTSTASTFPWTPTDRTAQNWVICYTDSDSEVDVRRQGSSLTNMNAILWAVGRDGFVVVKNAAAYQLFAYCDAIKSIENLEIKASYGQNYYGLFYCESLENLSNVTVRVSGNGLTSMFQRASSLPMMPTLDIDADGITDVSYAFQSCYALKIDLDQIDIGTPTNMTSFISDARRLVSLPRHLDLSAASAVDIAIPSSPRQNHSLVRIPETIVPNLSATYALSLSFLSANIDPDSVAKFDAGGNIVGGFAAFKPAPSGWHCAGKTSDATGATNTPTLTLGEYTRTRFTATQQTAIEDAIRSHGWTFAW